MSDAPTHQVDTAVLIDELRALRRTGLRRKKGRLPTLEAVAALLHSDPDASVYENIRGAIEIGSKDMAPKRCEAIRELLDAGKQDKRYLYLRRDLVSKILDVKKTRLEEVEPELLQELANQLAGLVAKRQEPAPHNTSPSGGASPPDDTPHDMNPVAGSAERHRLSIRPIAKSVIAGAAVALVALLVVLGFVLWPSDSTNSMPPVGSVINADTGAVVAHPVVKPSPMPAQIAGGTIFRACDQTADPSCLEPPLPEKNHLQVKVDDTIGFRMTLNDGYSEPVHYLKLEVHSQLGGNPPAELASNLIVGMSARWPQTTQGPYERVGELAQGDGSNIPSVEPIRLQLPKPGRYELQYIPGSTTLTNSKEHFLHRLPDGIMEDGIALENVGSPPSCFWCAKEYIRWVYFRARVVERK